MKILVGTLFIALAAFPKSVESSEGSSSGSSRSSGRRVLPVEYGNEVPRGLYFEDERGHLQPLNKRAALYELENFAIGLFLDRTRVVPLFNKKHEVVWQDRFNRTNQLVLNRDFASFFGMPGSLEEVKAAVGRGVDLWKELFKEEAELERKRPTENERERAAENERERAAENERQLAAENERKQAAENQPNQGNANRGKPRGRGGKYAKNRGN